MNLPCQPFSIAHRPLISLCADVGVRVEVQRPGGNVDLLALGDGVGLEKRIHVLHKRYLDIVVVSKRVRKYATSQRYHTGYDGSLHTDDRSHAP